MPDQSFLQRLDGWVRRHPLRAAVVAVLGVTLGLAGFVVARWVAAFEQVAAEEFAPEVADRNLGGLSDAEVEEIRREQDAPPALGEGMIAEIAAADRARLEALVEAAKQRAELAGIPHPYAASPPLPDEMFDSVLLIGADASGHLADVIIDLLLPADGSAPIMVSIPRDLYLPNPCTRRWDRINTTLGGCRGHASGPELVALTVGEFTGVEVDHFVRVDFDGFARVVDLLGGVTICPEAPSRDPKSGLDIQAPGCQVVDGYTALAWVRSRNTEQLIDGEWRQVAGSDFVRQQRQQDVLFQFARKLATYGSVAALTGALENLSHAVRTDSGLSLGEAASLAWKWRWVDRSDVIRLQIPVENARAPSGALVLYPTRSFNQLLASVYPEAAR